MGLTAIVNLTTGQVDRETTRKENLARYIGGRGYAAYLLYKLVDKKIDPLDPENPLIFATGPLTGRSWPSACRYTVTAKSPLTGGYGYAGSGGYFGPALKSAGIDVLIILGSSAHPVFLRIEGNDISVQDATDLWGLGTFDTEKALKDGARDVRVASIGPAGENLVRFSSIINDGGRAAARCGMGAVMGSKKLKAVVICGSKLPLPSSDDFKKLSKDAFRKIRENTGCQGLKDWGTPVLIDVKNVIGDLPSYNHQAAQFKNAHKVNAVALSRYTTARKGCFSCNIRCSRESRVETGRFKCEIEGPEYETIDSVGPMWGNDNLEGVIYVNYLCNKLGLDTISTGVTIAFAMECTQRNRISGTGRSINWGDVDTAARLIEEIAYRRGFGGELADGVKVASEKIGGDSHEWAMQVKGMELPRQEPRVAKAFGLGHATSNRGADHLYGLPTIDIAGRVDVAQKIFPELMPEIMEVTNEKYKADILKFTEEYCAVSDAVGVCKFTTTETYALFPEDIAQGLEALGYSFNSQELLQAGERIVNLERLFNMREGFSRKDDALPRRFIQEPLDVRKLEVTSLGQVIDKGPVVENLTCNLEPMLKRYYYLRGWDEEGRPTESKLKELGLQELTTP